MVTVACTGGGKEREVHTESIVKAFSCIYGSLRKALRTSHPVLWQNPLSLRKLENIKRRKHSNKNTLILGLMAFFFCLESKAQQEHVDVRLNGVPSAQVPAFMSQHVCTRFDQRGLCLSIIQLFADNDRLSSTGGQRT